MKKTIFIAMFSGMVSLATVKAQMGMEISYTASQFASLDNAKIINFQVTAPAKDEPAVPILETKTQSVTETEKVQKGQRVEVAEKNKDKKSRKKNKKEQLQAANNKRTFLTW